MTNWQSRSQITVTFQNKWFHNITKKYSVKFQEDKVTDLNFADVSVLLKNIQHSFVLMLKTCFKCIKM